MCLHQVSFRSRGEVRNINSVKALLCFQQGSPGNCSVSLLCVRVGSRFCCGWFSVRGILQGLCTCFCTGCIPKISLGTHNSSTKGKFFCPDVSLAPGIRLVSSAASRCSPANFAFKTRLCVMFYSSNVSRCQQLDYGLIQDTWHGHSTICMLWVFLCHC